MKKIFHFIIRLLLFLFVASLLWVVTLKYIPVYFTPLMFKRAFEQIQSGEMPTIHKEWKPLSEISKQMTIAVVASEDNLFMSHHGISWSAIKKAREDNKSGKKQRGGSTISQQTAKNVFTFGSRTWFRKGVESYFTLLIEWVWGKERIMEVYLNIVELGNGIYGVPAASELYFHKEPSKLTASQAALLAAALPNPLKYSVTKPGPYMLKRQMQIMALMPKMRRIEFLYPESKK